VFLVTRQIAYTLAMVFERDNEALTPLQVKLNEKEEEAERIRGEIERAKLDAQLLRLQLQAHGIFDESLIPPDMMSGGMPKPSEVPYLEIKRLLSWLADNCDMTNKQSFLVPEPEVRVGNDTVYLGHMSQWHLRVSGDLRFSIPFENEAELVEMLRKARKDTLDDDELALFARNWVCMTTELHTDTTPMPALFLINQSSHRACVVSSWPKVPVLAAQQSPQASFDPRSFFGCSKSAEPSTSSNTVMQTPLLQRAEEVSFVDTEGYASVMVSTDGRLAWARSRHDCVPDELLVEEIGVSFDANDEFTVTGPHGPCIINDPPAGPAQRWLVNGMVAVALEHGVRISSSGVQRIALEDDLLDNSLIAGDTVEVLYGEHWLRGVLEAVDGAVAHIRCDVDTNGAITRAPLDRVRLAGVAAENEYVPGSH
jgi:hypothetical protein